MTKQFLKFILVGFVGAVVNFLAYNLLLIGFDFVGWSWEYTYLVALLVAFYISVVTSFVLNRRFVFTLPAERAVPWEKALLKMCLVYSFTGVVTNTLLSLLWIEVFSLPRETVSILNDICSGPICFFLNKFWTFANKKKVC